MAGVPVHELVLTAVGLVGHDHDVTPVGQDRVSVAFFLGKNFWMVVNTTPPDPTDSLSRRSDRLSACTGVAANSHGTRQRC
jgi:hypothetical protein